MRVNAYTSSMIIHMKNFLGSLLFIFRPHLFIAYIILQTNQEWKQWVLPLTFDKHHSDKLHNKSISLYELKQSFSEPLMQSNCVHLMSYGKHVSLHW